MTWYSSQLEQLAASGNLRSIPRDSSEQSGGEGMVDFSSNDYLGIAAGPLQQQFMAAEENRREALTSSASRLLSARQSAYARFEALLEELYHRPALLFNSGYHANTGLISSLASAPGTLVVADRLVHASIIDGITLSRARFTRFRHNDFDHLASIIEKNHAEAERLLVVVEGVYSMDGDYTDIAALAQLKRRYPRVMLYVDEAHSFGVTGPYGLGLARGADSADYAMVDVVVGTLGKAAASMGAFAILSPSLRSWVINSARSFIFSTSLPPIIARWSQYVVEHITEMDAERAHLLSLAHQLSGEERYIYPHIIGSSEGALQASAELAQKGMKVLPIRVPTVPRGTERLRISLSAAHTAEQVAALRAQLQALPRIEI